MTAVHWLSAVSPQAQQQIRVLIDAATHRDGVAAVGEHALIDLAYGRTDHGVVTASDAIVGYLNVAPQQHRNAVISELVVHPEARRRGVGSAMVREVIKRSEGSAHFWAHGTLAAADGLARACNMRVVRELLQMRAPVPRHDFHPDTHQGPGGLSADIDIPDGVQIRRFCDTAQSAADLAALVAVNNSAFAWHPEQGEWSVSDVTERMAQPWWNPAGLFLAFDTVSTELLGFHWTKVHSDKPGLGEVYIIGVAPSAQGRGVGRALLRVGMAYLADQLADCAGSEVMLYTESDNDAAVLMYRDLGFAVFSVDTAWSA